MAFKALKSSPPLLFEKKTARRALAPRTQAAWEERDVLVSTACACVIIPRKTWESVYVWKLSVKSMSDRFLYGRLSSHPIPCGTTLIGHVTSGGTSTATLKSDRAGESLALSCQFLRQSYGGPRLDSCSMGLAR